MRLNYTASDHVRKVIARLGRAEDVKFSPNNSRLAVTSFGKNQIAIFDVCITGVPYQRNIALTAATEISSPYLKYPHGIDFIDEDRVIVANREGDATIFQLPRGGGGNCYQLDPIGVLGEDNFIYSPGAVSVIRKDQEVYEVLLCNNDADRVTKHVIDLNGSFSVKSDEVLLEKWLDFPDGVSVSGRWIAISNHDYRNVLLYDSSVSLHKGSDPDGILGCIRRPHGVRFTSDGRFVLVADYEGYVHIYMKEDLDWRGVHSPLRSLRVMNVDNSLAKKGIDPSGPKGIDVDSSLNALVTTCEVQPLAFFDFAAIVQTYLLQRSSACQDQASFQIKYELDRLYEVQQLAQLRESLSWRITAPLRWVRSSLTPIWRHRNKSASRVGLEK
jgi:DNA-binding beta-propeller fold protein YncE